MSELLPIERIEGEALSVEELIRLIRGERVIVDADLARIYGVTTKRLNEQVRRNRARFPEDFMFTLTVEENRQLVANCDRFKNLKHSSSLPSVFTEHGAIMSANVLRSECAVQASIQVVRAFVRLRRMILANKDLARKLEDLEKKYDSQFRVVFDAIRQLMAPPPVPPKRRIGF